MRAISLFSGCGGFEIGFDRAGIQTVLQAESDPWCLSVLTRHWPDVERLTDVRSVGREREPARRNTFDALRTATHIGGRQTGPRLSDSVDLVYGGFPCQDVSVAGKRAGLSGERSGLWHEFERMLRELRPRWTVIENVPGLLSSHSGRDFATILLGLEDLGYGWAYRVLDARWFGVPQRRRRVFVVGCLGDARRAAQVLAVCESCGGHPAPRRETGEAVAASLRSRSANAGIHMPGRGGEDDDNLIMAAHGEDQARSLMSREERNNAFEDNLLIANGLRASDGHHGHSSGDGADNLVIPHGPMGVRRLTPLECERLMGWPDKHTKYTPDSREIPDSHRYRMCGNGVVATVAEWLGHRLVQADAFVEAAA